MYRVPTKSLITFCANRYRIGFVRYLFRVVTYPGGSPLTDPNSLHLVNRASSYGPAHALLDRTMILEKSIP
jgi:hypothetical protein